MRTYKLLLKDIKQEDKWGHQDKDAIKLGEVAEDFTGEIDDKPVEFKKGQKVYYQYGTEGSFNGEKFVLVSLNSLVRDFE